MVENISQKDMSLNSFGTSSDETKNNSIEEHILLPSDIFGKSINEATFEVSKSDIITNLKFQLINDTNMDPTQVESQILQASNNNIVLAKSVALNLLNGLAGKNAAKVLKNAISHFEILGSAKNQPAKIDYKTPKEISLEEGILPDLEPSLEKPITDYLKGNITFNDAKKLLQINKDNARVVLTAIKTIDLRFDRLSLDEKRNMGFNRSTYELRTLCLQQSGGTMPSFEAYTKSINMKYFSNPFSADARKYAGAEYNYVPERVKEHSKILQSTAIEMMEMSSRFNDRTRTIYCLGGNTAVGKSRAAKSDKDLKRGLKNDEAIGAINPDNVKGMLRKDVPMITNQQIHVEGAQLSIKLANELKNKAVKSSMIVDERLGTPETVGEIIQVANETHAQVIYKDIDGPLMNSCLRVIGRNIASDPCVPFDPIANGQIVLRKNRKALIEKMINDPAVTSYQLFVTDEKNNQHLVLEKKDGKAIIYNQVLLDRATEVPSTENINEIRNTVITEDFIQQSKSIPGVSEQALRDHFGLTVGDALMKHSLDLPMAA